MLNQAKKIYLVGIKGVAMSNLAVILKKMGKKVSGSDVSDEFITDDLLKKNKIPFQIGFSASENLQTSDLLVYSSAHQGQNNPQVLQVKKLKIQTITQAELLAELLNQFKIKIAVCGCHGKTTTSSLLSYALINLGVKPSYMIGSSNFDGFPGGDYNSNDYFVVEADEYGVNPPFDLTPKFHLLNPDYILCTNIDYDHPDVYQNLNDTKKTFLKFFLKHNHFDATAPKLSSSKLFFCSDDENLMSIAQKVPANAFLTYGFSKSADLKIENALFDQSGSFFHLNFHQKSIGNFRISLFGEKNISNAAGVILLLLQLGFPVEKIKSVIKDFKGARRRFELIYENKGTYLFDDYAHHPEEIKATIMAAKSRFPKQRIIVIFQPHTYSRTQKLLKDFASSLGLADKAYILPIFASARENPEDFKVTSADIEKISPKKIKSVLTKKALIQLLTSNLHPQSIIFTMGAGDIYKLKDDIIGIISNVKTQSSKLK